MSRHPSLGTSRHVRALFASLAAFTFFLFLLTLTETPRVVPTAFADTPNADVALALAFASNEIAAGETFSYSYTIKNNGPDAATQVVLNARVPKGLTVENIDASRGECAVLAHATRSTINCALGKIALDETIRVTVRARVETNRPARKFKATVSTKANDADAANNRVRGTIHILAAPHQPEAPNTVFVVNNTTDAAGSCPTIITCSLRQAITDANASAGPHTINFDLPGAAPYTIALASVLPTITEQVTLDGTSEPDWDAAAAPIIAINGVALGAADGLTLDTGSDSSIVKGLVIQNFSGNGITILSDDNTIQTNCIGTTLDCSAAARNQHGILIELGSSGNVIGGLRDSETNCDGDCNVISGNTNPDYGNGIFIRDTTSGSNTITGNFIGVNWTADARLPNVRGIMLEDASDNIIGGPSHSASKFEDNIISGNNVIGIGVRFATATNNKIVGNRIGNEPTESLNLYNGVTGIEINTSDGNIIGTATAGEQNIITGNGTPLAPSTGNGILLSDASSNTITSNRIGTNSAGTDKIVEGGTDVVNQLDGIRITSITAASDNVITGNIISFNGDNGIQIRGNTSTGTVIKGNFIGVPFSGSTSLSNGLDGIFISGASPTGDMLTQIGGTTVADRNIISDNGLGGISISLSDGNTMQGNYIGVAADGTTALGNGNAGITIDRGNSNLVGSLTTTGGACDNGCNIIANNGAEGVLVSESVQTAESNRIIGNSIYSNSDEGIALVGGANNDQEFQTITVVASASTTIEGTFNGTLGTTYRLEFFYNAIPSPGCDSGGFGEGQVFIGALDVLGTGAPSPFSFFTASVATPVGSQVTGTATNLLSSDSSQFSACVAAVAATATPTNTLTSTPTPTDTPTNTPTSTPTNTRTNTPTFTPTNTRTSTRTPTNTRTYTPTPAGPTNTFTPSITTTTTVTDTPGNGNNNPTATPTIPIIPNSGGTSTPTPTIPLVPIGGTVTVTPTQTETLVFTDTPTLEPTFTPTTAPTITPAVIGTNTNTPDAIGTSDAATQTAAAQTSTLIAQVNTNTPAAPNATPGVGTATPIGGGPTPTPTGTGGGALGVAGGFPLVLPGGFADFNLPWFVQNVKTPQDAFSGGLAKILPNLLLALLLALLFAFFGNLQSNTLEQHEQEISGWLAPITRPLTALATAGAALDANFSARGLHWVWEGAKLIAVLFLYGLIFSFLDPSFSFGNPSWLLLVLAVMLSVGLVSIIDDVAKIIYSRRYGGEGAIGVNGANVGLAMGSMIFSRFAGLAPGIVFGSAGSAKGKLKGHPGTLSTLGIVSVGVTALFGWLMSALVPHTQGSNLWLSTLFLLIFAVGVQTLFFELIPVYGTMGRDFYVHNKWLWGLLFVGALFLFMQTQLNPDSNFVQAFNQRNMITLIIIVVAFCALSGGMWLYFWNRRRRR